LGFVSLHLFVLRKFDRGNGLIFGRPAGDLFLNGVAQINQYLTKTMKPLAGLSGIFGVARVSNPSSSVTFRHSTPVQAVMCGSARAIFDWSSY
jgi:hypothetical protein